MDQTETTLNQFYKLKSRNKRYYKYYSLKFNPLLVINYIFRVVR